jgi:hypothetical protein
VLKVKLHDECLPAYENSAFLNSATSGTLLSLSLVIVLHQNGRIHAKGSTWRIKFQDPSGPKTQADLITGEYPHFRERS